MDAMMIANKIEYRRNRAKRLLTHYLKLLFKSAGLRWDSDTEAEIEEVIDDVIEAGQVYTDGKVSQ